MRHVAVGQLADVHGVLVGCEGAVVEARVGVGSAQCEGGPRAVGQVVVCEVEVVGAEVGGAEGGGGGHGEAGGPGAGEGGVEGRRDGEDGGVRVVVGAGAGGAGCVVPEEEDGVVGEGGGGASLPEEVERAWARDIYLFGVLAGEDEDVVGGVVVREGEDGGLDGGEDVGGRGVGGRGVNEEGVFWTALKRVGGGLLAC